MTNAAANTPQGRKHMNAIEHQNGLRCISQIEALGAQAQLEEEEEDNHHKGSMKAPPIDSPLAPVVVETPEPRKAPRKYPDSAGCPPSGDIQRSRRNSSRVSIDGSKLRLPRASATAAAAPSPPPIPMAKNSPATTKSSPTVDTSSMDQEMILAEKEDKLQAALKEIEAGKIALAAERARTRTVVQRRVDEVGKKHAVEVAELEGKIRDLEVVIKGDKEGLKKATKVSDENNTLRVRIRDYEAKLEAAKNKIAKLETQLKVKDEDVLTSSRLVKNLTEQRDLFKTQLEGLHERPSTTELMAATARYEALAAAHKQALESEQKARGEAADLRSKNEAHARETARLHGEVHMLKNKIIKDQQDHLAERGRMSETFNHRIEEITREFADGVSNRVKDRRRSGDPAERLKLRVEQLTMERDSLLSELDEYRKEAELPGTAITVHDLTAQDDDNN